MNNNIPQEIQAISLQDILSIDSENRDANLGFTDGSKQPHNITHTLRKDGWFRGERTNVGIMFRKVKLLSKFVQYSGFDVYKISYKYYPDNYDLVEDNPKNWESGIGWLWVSNDAAMPDSKHIVAWMNSQVNKWKP